MSTPNMFLRIVQHLKRSSTHSDPDISKSVVEFLATGFAEAIYKTLSEMGELDHALASHSAEFLNTKPCAEKSTKLAVKIARKLVRDMGFKHLENLRGSFREDVKSIEKTFLRLAKIHYFLPASFWAKVELAVKTKMESLCAAVESKCAAVESKMQP